LTTRPFSAAAVELEARESRETLVGMRVAERSNMPNVQVFAWCTLSAVIGFIGGQAARKTKLLGDRLRWPGVT